MAAGRHMDKICIFSIILAVIITAFLINGRMRGTASAASDGENSQFAEEDLDADWDASGAGQILLDGEEIRISGGGAYSYDGDVYIARAGKYVLSGELTDGRVIVDADKSDKIWILLDGVSLNCADSAALLVEQAGKVFLTLAPDTENIITGGCAEDGTDVLTGAVSDAGDSGAVPKTSFGEEEMPPGEKGAASDAGDSETAPKASFGEEEMPPGEEGADSDARDSGREPKGSFAGENAVSDNIGVGADAASGSIDGAIYSRDDLTINGSGSLTVTGGYQHGIVCNDDLVVAGGTIAVTAVQDGIHANDSARFAGMDLTIQAGDDGVTVSNDEETGYIYMESGSITIPGCYEGLEAVNVTIAGGTLDLAPTDDGINASGGEESVLTIAGGDITIVNTDGRDADGLDSNGDIRISGGNIRISVTGNGGNCALDCGSENGGTCVISGGTVIACGGSAMAEGFSSSSEQNFIMYNGAAGEAGTTVTLKNSVGTVLLSWEIPCSFTSVIISTPDMRKGETCTLVAGDQEEEITVDNTSGSGGMTGMFGGMGKMQGGRKGMAGWGTGSAGPVNATNSIRRAEGMAPDLAESESTGEVNPPVPPDDQAGEMNPPVIPVSAGEEFSGNGQAPPEENPGKDSILRMTLESDERVELSAETESEPGAETGQNPETGLKMKPGTEQVQESESETESGVLQGTLDNLQMQNPDGWQNRPADGRWPDAGENGAAFGRNRKQAEMNGNAVEEMPSVSREALILTGVSALFLLGGLLAAWKIGR